MVYNVIYVTSLNIAFLNLNLTVETREGELYIFHSHSLTIMDMNPTFVVAAG